MSFSAENKVRTFILTMCIPQLITTRATLEAPTSIHLKKNDLLAFNTRSIYVTSKPIVRPWRRSHFTPLSITLCLLLLGLSHERIFRKAFHSRRSWIVTAEWDSDSIQQTIKNWVCHTHVFEVLEFKDKEVISKKSSWRLFCLFAACVAKNKSHIRSSFSAFAIGKLVGDYKHSLFNGTFIECSSLCTCLR
jgi:hypothetical protein